MRERRDTVRVKTDLTLFIVRFTLFIYYFIKTNSILFSIKQIKYPFYFLSNHYFNTLISLYLFNYKNLIIKLYLFTNNNPFLN